MGIISFFANRERQASQNESKDEKVLGEIVRAMAHKSWPALSFSATEDWQRVRFATDGDDVFSAVYITLERKTGIIADALLGPVATLHITAEIKNRIIDPVEQRALVERDVASLFKTPWVDTKISHEFNAIHGTRKVILELDKFVDQSAQRLHELIDKELGEMREKLRPYHKAPARERAPTGTAEPIDPDKLFAQLVRKSWELQARHQYATQIDEVLLGAVIASTLDNDYALIDLTSDGTYHYLRFEAPRSANRIVFQLRHMTPSLATSAILGHEAEVTVGFGERMDRLTDLVTAVSQDNRRSGYLSAPDPGAITLESDLASQYVYAQVMTLWDIDDYLVERNTHQVDYPKLTRHIGAIIHALSKYLHSRAHG